MCWGGQVPVISCGAVEVTHNVPRVVDSQSKVRIVPTWRQVDRREGSVLIDVCPIRPLIREISNNLALVVDVKGDRYSKGTRLVGLLRLLHSQLERIAGDDRRDQRREPVAILRGIARSRADGGHVVVVR